MISLRSNGAGRNIKSSRHYVGRFDAPISNAPPPNDYVTEPPDYRNYDFKNKRYNNITDTFESASVPAPTPKPKMNRGEWRDRKLERNKRIVRMRDELNLSAAEIGARLGVSRSAVIGVCWRHDQAKKK